MDTATTTAFTEAGPFTEGSSKPFGGDRQVDQRYDNQPPLEERVMLEFEDDLAADGVKARIEELLESAAKAPETIEDEATAGKVGDFLKMARAAEQRVDDAREKHNRPLINARNNLKAKADQVLAPLLQAGATLRSRLNAYIAAEEAKRRELERAANEAARRAQEEAERIARETTDKTGFEVAAPVVMAPKIDKPVARGDLGSRVGARTVWKHERQVPIKQLPKQILENQKVVEAVDSVIASMVRSGCRELKGVRIFETTEASVR
jgi:hypothetical protein